MFFRKVSYLMLLQKRQQVVICFVAGAMIGGFVFFRYLPLRRRIKTIEQMKVAQSLAISKASAEKLQLPVFKEELLRLKGAVGNYEANVPKSRGLGVFLQQIANLMNGHNLSEQIIQPGKEIEGEGLHCIPISMRCKGRLKQIFEFFSSLQSLDRLVRIERIELVNDSGLSGEVSMQTETVVYYTGGAGSD